MRGDVYLRLIRFGLLTAVFTFLTLQLLDVMPLTTNLSSWFASATILSVIIVLGLGIYGTLASIGGSSALKGLSAGTLPSSGR